MFIKETGFCLTEQLLGVLLSSLILVGLVNYYITFKNQFLLSQIKMDELIEREQIINLLRHRIQHAGFTPCMNLKNLLSSDLNQPIHHMTIEPTPKHTLTIRRMNEEFIVAQMTNDQTLMSHAKGIKFKNGDKIMVSDCHHAEVTEVESIKYSHLTTHITLSNSLRFDYRDSVYVGVFLDESFHLAQNGNQHSFVYHLNRSEVLSHSLNKFEVQLAEENKITILLRFNHDKTDTTIEATIRS